MEISIVSYKSLIQESVFRIDSEFQLKHFVENYNLLLEKPFTVLDSHLKLLTDGKHGGVTLTEKGVLFLRTTNVKENAIDLSDQRFISTEESSETKRAELQENDLLLTSIGSVGACAKVPKDFPLATINQNLVRLVLNNKKYASLFCTFLNSKFGQYQILRLATGNVYQMINYPNLRGVMIPNFSLDFAKFIDDLYENSELQKKSAKQAYQQAERVLLEELGLVGFKPSTQGVSIKTFAQSFGTTGRLDAEYYQPKYDEMVQHLYTAPHNRLDELVNIQKSIEPGSEHYADEGIPFLRVSDLNKSGTT